MKILYIITKGDTIGGAQKHLIDLINGLSSDENEVVLVYGGVDGVIEHWIEDDNVRLYRIKSLSNDFSIMNNRSSFLQVLKIVRMENPDLIHLHSTKAGLLFRFLRLYEDTPVIYTVHGWGFVKGTGLIKGSVISILERMTRGLVSHYILVSQYDLNLGLSKGIFSKSTISLIYNGVKDTFDQSRKKRKMDSRLRLLMTARFSKQKDQLSLYEAIKDLAVDLYFLGDGPTRSNLEKLVDQNSDKPSKIYFEGHINDVESYLYETDVFLLISNWEGFPISTIEAMSKSLPVVVTDVGGSAEVFSNNRMFGYAVPHKNVPHLRRIVIDLLENKSTLEEMGREARKVFTERFTLNKMIRETKEVYRKVLME